MIRVGRASRTKRVGGPRRRCADCGFDKPADTFRQIRLGTCADAPDAQVCGDCERRYIVDGFLYQDRDGAVRLGDMLPVPNCVWIPPTKDARDFVQRGGTTAMVDALTKSLRWTQPTAQSA